MSEDLEPIPGPVTIDQCGSRDGLAAPATAALAVEKVVRDGMVAVLISPGFGAGWSTWAGDHLGEFCLFDRRLVEAVEAGQDVGALAEQILGEEYIYTGGASDLKIKWLPVGTRFVVEGYDGNESLRTIDDLSYTA